MLHIKIKKLREGKDITQAEFAKLLEVSPSTVGMYEQGRRVPDKETLVKIANIFNVTTDYLLRDIEVGEDFVDELRDRVKQKGYDISDMSNDEIADMLVRAIKLGEIFKSK